MNEETIKQLEDYSRLFLIKEKEVNEKIKIYSEILNKNIFKLDDVFLDINVNANLLIRLGFGYISILEGCTIYAKVCYLGYLGGLKNEYTKKLLECPLSIKIEAVPFLDKLVNLVILECNKILSKPID